MYGKTDDRILVSDAIDKGLNRLKLERGASNRTGTPRGKSADFSLRVA